MQKATRPLPIFPSLLLISLEGWGDMQEASSALVSDAALGTSYSKIGVKELLRGSLQCTCLLTLATLCHGDGCNLMMEIWSSHE